MELLGAIVGAVAVLVGVYTLVTPAGSTSAIGARLGRLNRENTPARSRREETLARPFVQRVGAPLAVTLGALRARSLPTSVAAGFERKLQLAGEPISLHAFLTIQATALGSGLFLAVVVLLAGISGIPLLALLFLALITSIGPLLWLRSRVSGRQQVILRAMPDTVDLIVTMVEAGMSIDAALWKVAETTEGPLAEELYLAVRETTMGRSRRDALLLFLERTGVPALRSFIQAILHAHETGVPLGPVLRAQAVEVRLQRRQRAEAAANRAPVKMVIVLVVFILPALLILMMGPAVLQLFEVLGEQRAAGAGSL